VAGNEPVIIKKVKKGGHGGHHGGAWKVAYADFVTAMMAFFLLLWLLNATTEDQKKGIADYFSPMSVSRSTSGAGGVLGGRTLVVDGNKLSENGVPSMVMSIAPPPREEEDEPEDQKQDNSDPRSERGKAQRDFANRDGDRERGVSDKEVAQRLAEKEQESFQKAEAALRQAIQEAPALRELSRNIIVDNTPEGLRIQLVDQEQQSMFPSGSASLNDRAKNLTQLVAQVVAKLPNKLSVSGHTDATPFRFGNTYGNWELSTDRANASRRALIENGVDPARFRLVTGNADRQPLITSDPFNPSNRRIAIVLLRDQPLAAAQ
jgi:chemotaxis protein MotB